jgi:ATP-binding cassette subfamily B protein
MLRRRFIVPEVIQTSAMDCGPACLSSLLSGFGIQASYERLREACQTDVDGTSINTLEEIAGQLGLQSEQIMVPADYLTALDPRPLPAITVITLPSGVTHFVVVWRRAHDFVQIMDPAVGRIWRREQDFLRSLYVHRMTVPIATWREWAGSEQFLAPLRRKMSQLGCRSKQIRQLLSSALMDPGWRSLAALEAAVRALEHMVHAGAFRRGREASRSLQHLVTNSQDGQSRSIPAEFWSVQSTPDLSSEEITVRGVVLVAVRGRKAIPKLPLRSECDAKSCSGLNAVLHGPQINPARALLQSLFKSGKLLAPLTMLALLLSAAAVTVEAVLLRGLVDVFADFKLAGERLAVIAGVISFIFLLMLLDYSIAAALLRLGRRLEAEFRLTVLQRLPRIADRYFRSRLSSDMAQRSHSTHRLRVLPSLYGQLIRTAADLMITGAAIIWLDNSALTLTIVAVSLNLALPLLFNPVLRERDLKVRNHVGALTRFYLDAMLGLTPLRAHCAERAFRREHTGVLREWAGSALNLQKVAVLMDALQLVSGFGFAVLLLQHMAAAPQAGVALLLLYWALKIPMLAQDFALAIRQYPAQRNLALRILEPLNASLESVDPAVSHRKGHLQAAGSGVAVRFDRVSVEAAGHVILKDVNLEITSGTHVAIVGASGAGKSSLVGLLLGLQAPASGSVLVDGTPVTANGLSALRRETAWIDPAVQLWNRSLLQNLQYGSANKVPDANLMEEADLLQLLATFPDGLRTSLGENGGIVSGGEGQRVRLGRTLLKDQVRLAVLDEPFRGLERPRRRALLSNARKSWAAATLFCITHDIAETLHFDRVLVVESGEIVEDGCPLALAERHESRFRSMLVAESELQQSLWSGDHWRRIRLEDGRVAEQRPQLSAVIGRNA